MYVMHILERASDGLQIHEYLKSYDPEAYGGRGDAVFTNDPKEAMEFENASQAWDLWKTIPKVLPKRPDGKPNRPLVAFTISIVPISQVRREMW